MRLRIAKFHELAIERGFKAGNDFLVTLGGGKKTLYAFEIRKCQIGYDLVKRIYNVLGEEATLDIIDFEEMTINEFRGKFIQVGTQLY